MLTRCENPHAVNYCDYGGRGIKVCEEWHDFKAFYDWAVANGYRDNLTIDRIDNNRGYEPGNCRWVTRSVQAKNRRSTRLIEFGGETKCIADWARQFGVDRSNLTGIPDDAVKQKISEYARRKL
jgi:hypothetical protein